ncbi:uncharacterized protein [Eucyclogobius newberryi]|uniref:uncharacterized protein isoform X5 n=1 Tax=Eucyclogobius newberryi TaxID=166745 RepID=UPI003B5B04FF
MSVKSQALRALVLERLAVAADEIFALFEQTIAQFEEEVLRSKLMQQPRVLLYKEDIQTVTVGVDVHCDQVIKEEPIKMRPQEVNPPIELQYPSMALKSEERDPTAEQRRDPTGEQCDGEEPGCSSDLILDNNRPSYSFSDTDDSIDWGRLAQKTTRHNNAYRMEDSAEFRDNSHGSESFLSAEALEKHLEIHAEQRWISCPICNKVLSSKSTFKQHLITHSKHKPFTCSVCKHRFSQKRHFDEHMRIHTGEKPLSCAKCDMKFRQQYSLMRHVLSKHSTDKPFRCSICQKGFVEKWHYEVHMRKHAGAS